MFTKTDIERYFLAEKQESLIFLLIGMAGIVLAVIFFFVLKTSFYKGASVPLLLLGLVLGTVGYTIYNRSDNDRIRHVYAYDMNPSQLKNTELPRMKTVMKSFVVYRYTEVILAITGICLFLYFRHSLPPVGGESWGGAFWKGFGLTLAVMAMLALAADYFAEKRGRVYTKGIESFVTKLSS